MAFAVASQVDPACLADEEFASASAAAQFISDSCLADGPVGRVGLEIEAHCYDPADPQRRPRWDEITGAVGVFRLWGFRTRPSVLTRSRRP